MSLDRLRTVRLLAAGGAYILEMYATPRTDRRGQTTIGYRFTREGDASPLFEGEDFHGSPMHADDSDDTVRALLGFLTLRPGDTDREYFEKYTETQLAFCAEDAEELSLYAMDPEEGEEALTLEEIDTEGWSE